MGNSSRNPQDYQVVRNYRADEWEQLPNNNGQLWRSRRTHEIAQVHRLFTVPTSTDMDRFELRTSQENFVKVYYLALASRQGLCFNEPFVRLLVEFIPVRLKEVDSLELEEALTVLAAVLKGFHALTVHFGAIEPHEELIGFNQWGKAKVWLNKDVSCNFPEHAVQTNFDKSRVQASHVRKIFDLVQRKCQSGQLPLGLRQLFRANNPGFLQAILIIEQYSYENELSLQRYIRTDIVVRKTSALALTRQPSHNRISNSEIIVERELKRIHSVDALNTQKWTNVSQSTVSIPNVQFKENIGFNAGMQGYRSPVKVSFQRSRETFNVMPFRNVTSMCSPTRLMELRSEQASPLSILGSPQRSIFQPSPIKLEQPPPVHKKMDIFPQVQEQLLVESLKKQQHQQQPQIQISSQVVSKEILEHHRQSYSDHQQQAPFQAGHQSYRSIIDKVNSQLMSAEETTPIQAYEQQEFQVSGTFNYKLNTEKDQFQHLHYPLQQIGEEEDCSKDRQGDSDSKIREPQEEKWAERDQANNLPLGFESFAPNKLKMQQIVSFAPNMDNYPTQQSIRSQENVKTSQSFDCQDRQKPQERENSIRAQQQQQQQPLYSSESVHSYHQPPQPQQNLYRQQPKPSPRQRVSINLCYQQQNPFFGHCTPIQSKFDVVPKRDSVLSRDSQREERPSAFAHLETDQEIENYVRNKYGNYLEQNKKYQEEVKVGRVQSQYQKHYVKENEGYDFARKDIRPSIEIACPRTNNRISNILEKPEEDFLDVNFLEKSLDKRYSNPKKTRTRDDEDQLNIAKLDEGLMKFSTSKGSFADQSSKSGPRESISQRSKWEATTGFQCPPVEEKKKRTVRIETTPTQEFNYQLSYSNYAQPTRTTTAKSPIIPRETPRSGKVSQAQKESIDARYDKYVKNNKEKPSGTPSIAQIAGIRGDSRLMLSPIPERRGEEQGRLSYDQLRSFLWG